MTDFIGLLEGWSVRPLGDLVEFLDHMRKPVKESERQNRRGPYPYYGANGQIDWIDGYIFDEPLVLLAEDGGFFGSKEHPIAYKIEGKSWVNNHAHALRPSSTIDIDYLHRVLSYYDVTPFLSGSTRFKLTKTDAGRIPIPLPSSLATQRRIADILTQADHLKQKRERANELTNKIIQSVFLKMFGDPIGNEKKWIVESLDETCDKITDGKHGDCNDLSNSGYYFISAKDIIDGKIEYSSARQITKDDFLEVHKRTDLDIGDILISNSGTIGKIAIATDEEKVKKTTFQKSVAVVKNRKQILNSYFLQYFLELSKEHLINQSSGSSQKNLLLRDLKKFKILLPPIELQNQFASLARKIEAIKALQNKSNREIHELFQSLMRKAFRGELVKESGTLTGYAKQESAS